LIKRGEALLAQGDVVSPRLFLKRAAEARDPHATALLGATYDPDMLGGMGVVGLLPEPEQAQSWYKQAAAFGSREASQRLAALSRFPC
jgi:TPR repeat protein